MFNLNDISIIIGVVALFLLVCVLVILRFISIDKEYHKLIDKEKKENNNKEKDNGKL